MTKPGTNLFIFSLECLDQSIFNFTLFFFIELPKGNTTDTDYYHCQRHCYCYRPCHCCPRCSDHHCDRCSWYSSCHCKNSRSLSSPELRYSYYCCHHCQCPHKNSRSLSSPKAEIPLYYKNKWRVQRTFKTIKNPPNSTFPYFNKL